MKILVISENIPKPDFASGDRRFLGILEILAKKHEVVFCIPNKQPWLKPEENEKYIKHIENIGVVFLPFNQGLFEKTIEEERYDIGFFEFYWIAERYMDQFVKAQPEAVTVVDSVDLHFAREETQQKLGQISEEKVLDTKKKELGIYNAADITIAVSDEDYDRLYKAEKVGLVSLVPNIVPTVPRTIKEREPSVLFIGCYAWPPNVDAMKWFVDEVWPAIYKVKEDAELWIVGSKAPEEITSMADIPGIKVLGWVPETTPYLEKAAISIAPLRFGGGMKGKVNEAMAHGLPVVSTSIGAQGFNAKNDEEIFVADTPEEFADAVLKLLNDPELQRSVGLAGQKMNESLCSPEYIEKQLDKMIDLYRQVEKSTETSPPKKKSWISKLFCGK